MKRELYGVLAVVLVLFFALSCGTSRRTPKQGKEERVKSSTSSTMSREERAEELETEITPDPHDAPQIDPQPETHPVPSAESHPEELEPEIITDEPDVQAISDPHDVPQVDPQPETHPVPSMESHPEELEAEITPDPHDVPQIEPQPETQPETHPVPSAESHPEELEWEPELQVAEEELIKSEAMKPTDLLPVKDSVQKQIAESIAEVDSVQQPVVDSIAHDAEVEKKDTTQRRGIKTETEDNKKMVYIDADLMRPIKLEDGTKAVNLLGNVVIYHNGAVITCDSAVRYSPTRLDCFRRVVINKETTFVYGDRAYYNGDHNLARVYAPIIKMVDQDATLYTYYFSFNTLDNIAEFRNGGTMQKGNNQMEAQRGFYYVDQRDFIGVDQVELRDEQYSLKSDSVIYNMDTELAQFFTKTHIWSDKSDILIADKGSYNRITGIYNFTENSYILTDKQEIWSEALDYDSRTESAKLYRDIQIREEEKHITAFGDYGEYWGEREEAMLTLDPSVMSYDPQEPDTLYMRSDSMFLFSHDYKEDIDWSIGRGKKSKYDEAMEGEEEELSAMTPSIEGDGVDIGADHPQGAQQGIIPDAKGLVEEVAPTDSLLVAGIEPMDSVAVAAAEELVNEADMSPKELKEYRKERDREAKLKATEAKQLASESRIKAKEQAREAKLKAKELARSAKKAKKKGEFESVDTLLLDGDSLVMDSLNMGGELADSVAVYKQTGVNEEGEPIYDSTVIERYIPSVVPGDSLVEEGDKMVELDEEGNPIVDPKVAQSEEPQDSLQRVIRAFRDVRVYRKDFQVVCDSLVGFSKDSTLHLYIEPVLWANENQIKADTIDIFTKNQEIERAEFFGSPFMSSEVDPDRKYNQVRGRFMEAWFRNNEIYKHNVMGNGETIYYMQDEDTGDYMGLLSVECADITFLIDGQKMDQIIYRVNPVFFIYPMEKIPLDQPEFLEGFKWEDERRPKGKEEIMTRKERPTQREYVKSLPEPLFPLTKSILEDRDAKISIGIWRERNDELNPRAVEFIHYLMTQ